MGGVSFGRTKTLVSFFETEAVIMKYRLHFFIVEINPVVVWLQAGAADDLAGMQSAVVHKADLVHVCNLEMHSALHKHKPLIKYE
jgi:hypothetical protein